MLKCFVLEATTTARRELRRYVSSSRQPSKCILNGGYHDACAPFSDVEAEQRPNGRYRIPDDDMPPKEASAGWPTHCACCDYAFTDDDEWQLFGQLLYRRADTGELTTLRDAPPGALWRSTWLEHQPHQCGPDGQSWHCKTPGGDWHIDGRASNCTMPDDWEHRCWIRHGTAPDFTVDKNGATCGAGAGSIQAGNYHGFLLGGYLT